MASYLSLTFLLALVSVLTYLQPTESATCTKLQRIYQQCTKSQSTSYTYHYYVGCGLFNWWRCTRYRRRYHYRTAYKTCSKTITVQECCPGWYGTGCTTHNRPPVKHCPASIVVRTALIDSPAQVSWSPPRFTEPYGFTLRIQSPYPGHHASLPIGTTEIEYVATSTNNNLQATCRFFVTVLPPLPVPEVYGHSNLDELSLELDQNVTLQCRARAASVALQLSWFFNGRPVPAGTRYTTFIGATVPNYWDSQNELTFTTSPDMDQGSLVCKGQGLDSSTDITLTISVDSEFSPRIQFCPSDQTLNTTERGANVTWEEPQFVEPNNETIRVTRNLDDDQLEYLTIGVHVVRYVATNERSGKRAVCQFTLDIQPFPCPDPIPPANGAVVCGLWTESYVRICTLMCDNTRDVPQFSPVYKTHVCGASGQWLPPLEPVNCSEYKSVANYLKSAEQYYPGSCEEHNTTAHQETSFFNLVTSSAVNALVSDEGNDDVIMDIQC